MLFVIQAKDLMNSREVNRFPPHNAIFDPVATNLDPRIQNSFQFFWWSLTQLSPSDSLDLGASL